MRSPVFFIFLVSTISIISGSVAGFSTPDPEDPRIQNETIFERIGGLFSKGADFGKDLLETLTDWIEGLIAGAITKITGLIVRILEGVSDPLGINEKISNAGPELGFVTLTTYLFLGVLQILVFIGLIRIWVLIADIVPVL